jgi:DGQHR domain-containing protein
LQLTARKGANAPQQNFACELPHKGSKLQGNTAFSPLSSPTLTFHGQIGRCGDRDVFLGFASAADLFRASFPDILDEVEGTGYQRRFHRGHSLEFKRYIHKTGATTIPLTFNLRSGHSGWKIDSGPSSAILTIDLTEGPVMAQVDCQHRLGYLRESPIPLAFMTYLGLSIDEEMETFRVINGKAKGLSGSLLDFTESRLVEDDLKTARPELFLALKLHEERHSPWYQRLDLGGNRTTGPLRVASLRTMQKAARRFLREAGLSNIEVDDTIAAVVIDFWNAVAQVLANEWERPRQHMLAKGIGVYSLMSLAGDLYRDAVRAQRKCSQDYFVLALSPFIRSIDWSNGGPLKGFGGASGADAALELLRQLRTNKHSRFRTYGKQKYSAN